MSLKVIHKPAGYEAYKDQVPIRKPNWKMILIMVGSVFVCGAICSAAVLIPQLLKPSPTEVANSNSIEDLTEDTTVDPAFSALISVPLPTHTPIIDTSTPEILASPTSDLQATVQFVSAQLNLLQSQTPIATWTMMPSNTPMPTIAAAETTVEATSMIFEQYAVVNVNCVVIRAAPGRDYEALDSVCAGARFGIIETYGDWTRIYHPNHQTAWIASWLLRTETP